MKPYVISESTLYTILKRLEEGVEREMVEHNSRLPKYYKITNRGLSRIEFKEYWRDMENMYNFIIKKEEPMTKQNLLMPYATRWRDCRRY